MERMSLTVVQDPGRLIKDFCKDCELRGMTLESIRRYKSSLLILAEFVLNKGVDINEANIHLFKDFLQYIIVREGRGA